LRGISTGRGGFDPQPEVLEGQVRLFTLKLDDGSEHTAEFLFK
jgi:hypothetical protein